MKKNVFINMKSIQKDDGNDKTEIELITSGTFSKKGNGVYVITYEDSETTGFYGSTTDITVENNSRANIIRNGSTVSNLVIENGKKHFCYYDTPFGDFMVGIRASKIENELTDDGGRLYMNYTVDVNSSLMSNNEIILDITPAGN